MKFNQKNIVIGMLIFYVVCAVLLIAGRNIILVSNSIQAKTLSEDEQERIKSSYHDALNDLCDLYGLNDVIIEIGEFGGKEGHYLASIIVTSEKFSKLDGPTAFQFAKGASKIDSQQDYHIDSNKTVSISFSVRIKSGEDTYEYDSDISGPDHVRFEYLANYYSGESYVTYRNGALSYDIFTN